MLKASPDCHPFAQTATATGWRGHELGNNLHDVLHKMRCAYIHLKATQNKQRRDSTLDCDMRTRANVVRRQTESNSRSNSHSRMGHSEWLAKANHAETSTPRPIEHSGLSSCNTTPLAIGASEPRQQPSTTSSKSIAATTQWTSRTGYPPVTNATHDAEPNTWHEKGQSRHKTEINKKNQKFFLKIKK